MNLRRTLETLESGFRKHDAFAFTLVSRLTGRIIASGNYEMILNLLLGIELVWSKYQKDLTTEEKIYFNFLWNTVYAAEAEARKTAKKPPLGKSNILILALLEREPMTADMLSTRLPRFPVARIKRALSKLEKAGFVERFGMKNTYELTTVGIDYLTKAAA